MKSDERLIQFFDISICGKTKARGIDNKLVSPRTLNELMSEFKHLRELNLARQKVSPQSVLQFTLEDLDDRVDCWVLMINLVDGNAAHLVTQKFEGTVDDRQVIELTDRGLESSAHIVIMKDKDSYGKHLVLLEKNNSIPFKKVSAFLNKLCRLSAKKNKELYQRPHPSGEQGKTINTYCLIEFLGHPSNEFKEELVDGIISDIKLSTDVNILKGYDANAHPELISTEIKMQVTKNAVRNSGGNWQHLQKALSHADSLDIPFVRVQFEDSTGTSHTAILNTDTHQLSGADKYVKKRKIKGFNNSLSTAFPVINEEIIRKILDLV